MICLSTTMNRLFCFIFGLVALYDVCQAQFGFASQNCLGSNCNQNNVFGRRRRQVLEDILAEVEEKEIAKHNEVVRIKREIADMLNSLTMDVLEQEAKEEAVVVEHDVHTQEKRDAEADPQFGIQNCVGSNCNQNNLFGRKKREIAETIESLVHEQVKREAEADPQLAISNCVGSNCNTNNFFGRFKRETLDLIKSVAKELLEAEEEDATVENEDREADSNVQ